MVVTTSFLVWAIAGAAGRAATVPSARAVSSTPRRVIPVRLWKHTASLMARGSSPFLVRRRHSETSPETPGAATKLKHNLLCSNATGGYVLVKGRYGRNR